MKTIFLLCGFLFAASGAFSQITNILLDYDAVDGIVSADSGADYGYTFWKLNAHLPDVDPVRGLHWAVVRFDTLYDADSFKAYTYSDKALTIDSIRVAFKHKNITATPDTIVINVYQYEGTSGIMIDSLQQITNAVLYDTTIVTTTSLTDSTNIGYLIIHPDYKLNTGQKFLAGVYFYGDLSNTFELMAGYADFCGMACFDTSAAPSVFAGNSNYKIIYWDGPFTSSGVNSLVYDCDGDLNPGEPEECELSPIQNLAISAFVSFGTDTTDTTTVAGLVDVTPFRIYPNPADELVAVQLREISSEVQLSLADAKGMRLFQKSYSSFFNKELKLDVSNLPAGLYFLTVMDKSQKMTVNLVKN